MEIAPLNKLLLSTIFIHLPFIIIIYLFYYHFNYYFSLFINRRKRESFSRCLVQSVLRDEVQPWREYSVPQPKTIHLMSKWKHLQRKWKKKKAGIISPIRWLLTNALALDFLWRFLHSIASTGWFMGTFKPTKSEKWAKPCLYPLLQGPRQKSK